MRSLAQLGMALDALAVFRILLKRTSDPVKQFLIAKGLLQKMYDPPRVCKRLLWRVWLVGLPKCIRPTGWNCVSPDARGKLTERNSQTVFNAAGQPSLRWRGDRRSAAHQAEDSLKGSLGYATTDEIVPVLSALGYEPAFKRAFVAEQVALSSANFGNALDAYQRTLITPAPFDAYGIK